MKGQRLRRCQPLGAYPGGLQAGGGIRPENAEEFPESRSQPCDRHVLRFPGMEKYPGKILQNMVKAVGKERLVLDLSCRKRDGDYYIVTDRWQKFTDVTVTPSVLDELSGWCDEFLIPCGGCEGKKPPAWIRN